MRIAWVPHLCVRHFLTDSRFELREPVLSYQNPRTRDARLAAIHEAGLNRKRYDIVKVRIIQHYRDTVSGMLRINTSAGAARQVMPLLVEFLQRHSEMRLDIVTEGRLIDIVADGFDAGIRLAETVPQDMIAVPFAVVGSPAYFARHKPPRTPGDLHAHRSIRARMPSGAIYQWEFERHGEAVRIDAKGSLMVDEPGLVQQAAHAGLGLAYLSEWNVATDLRAGTLVRVLEGWTPPLNGLCLYYSGRRHAPAGLRALIDMIREHADARRPQRERPTSKGKARMVRR